MMNHATACDQNQHEKTRQVTVKLPTALYNEIKKLSIDRDIEVYTAFREALTEYLEKYRGTATAQTTAERKQGDSQ